MEDLRHALRLLRTNPAFAGLAVLTLALGVVACTVAFGVVTAVLLRPLPYRSPGELVMLWEGNADLARTREASSPANLLDLSASGDTGLAALAGFFETSRTLQGTDEAEQVTSAQVTTAFFDVLGVTPAAGRVFGAVDTSGAALDGTGQYRTGDRVVVISHGLWQRRYGGRPDLVGQSIVINRAPWRVVGVLPAGFAMPSREVDLWMPWDPAPSLSRGNTRDSRFVRVVARLAPGVSIDEARARLAAVYTGLADAYPKANRGWSATLVPLHEAVVGSARPGLLALAAAVMLVLLIACANVASLLLARAAGRRREVAIRAALGASRSRIVRQLTVESLAMSVAAGIVAVAAAPPALSMARALAPPDVPRLDEAAIDARVMLFAMGVSIVTGLAFGLVPALRGSATTVASALRDGASRSTTSATVQRAQRATVVAEVALALVLVTLAALAARSFQYVRSVDAGFNPSGLLTLHITLDSTTYSGRAALYFQDLADRLAALPGATSAAAVSTLPLSDVGVDFERPYWRAGEPEPGGEADKVSVRMATPGFFDTMGIALVRGRDFTRQDRREAPAVLIVSEGFARRVWGGAEAALGQQLMLDYNRGKYAYEVIGVSGDVRYYGPRNEARAEVYIPHAQNAYLPMNVVVRAEGDPARLRNAALDVVRTMDPTQPAHNIRTMDELLADTLAPDRFVTWLFLVMALVALVLATTGVYGLMTYVVAERTHETGVRMALGAQASRVVGGLVGQSLRLTLAGVAIGGLAAWGAARALARLLFGVSPTDPLTFAAATAVLVGTGTAAAWLAARRAVRIDPVEALRCE